MKKIMRITIAKELIELCNVKYALVGF